MPIPTLPFCFITNLFKPDEEAVNISPSELSMIKEAVFVEPEMEATGVVLELPRISSVAVGDCVFMPTRVLLVSRLIRFDAIFRAVVLVPKDIVVLFARLSAVPLIVRLPPNVVNPVPVVIALFVVVFMDSTPDTVSRIGDEPVSEMLLSASCKIFVPESKMMLPVVVPPMVRL